jgi:copper chaperone CopZ
MATTLDFEVTGMTCDHCVHAVTEAIKEVPGVTEVTVSLQEKQAHVAGDAIDINRIVAAVKDEGYEAALKS